MVTGVDGPFDLDECPGCSTRFESVAEGGLFGCPACYSAFNKFASAVIANDSGLASRQ